MSQIFCGIDNGVTGSIGIISNNFYSFYLTPVKQVTNYQKTNKNITRIDYPELKKIFLLYKDENIKILLERPLVNPTRFQATTSALRAFEATIICLEELFLPYDFIDSKIWQKNILPNGIKGSEEQKKASMSVGCRLFPKCSEQIIKHKDADGLLIAEWAKRNNC